VKVERQQALMAIQAEISRDAVGRLGRHDPDRARRRPDKAEPLVTVGRLGTQAPDVDGCVYLDGFRWIHGPARSFRCGSANPRYTIWRVGWRGRPRSRFMSFLVLLARSGAAGVQRHPRRLQRGWRGLECPEFEHIPVTSPQIIGEPIVVNAHITDESGVLSAILYYKIETLITWNQVPMDGPEPDVWRRSPAGRQCGAAACTTTSGRKTVRRR
jgi:hypothetical protein